MAFLSSPRRRRQALWIGAALVAVGGVLLLNAALPSHGGPVRTTPLSPQAVPSGGSASEEAVARRARATVQPLANRFVDELVNRRDLDRAYALLAPKAREHYSLLDWQAGRNLPISGASGTGGASVVFAGGATVGLVASFSGGRVLFAVRFDKLSALGWRVAYMHQGHASSRVTEADYSPAGFAPGSQHETVGTWLILLGGLALLIAVAAIVDRRLG